MVADSCLHPGIEHIILLKCLNLSKLSLCLALCVFFLSNIHHVPLKFATCMPNTESWFIRMNLKTTPFFALCCHWWVRSVTKRTYSPCVSILLCQANVKRALVLSIAGPKSEIYTQKPGALDQQKHVWFKGKIGEKINQGNQVT